jgi:uncharacterized protein (DUF488 family)
VKNRSTSQAAEASTIWTIGHSTRSLEEFKEILSAAQIEMIVDVRAFPSSRRYPHFNKDALSAALSKSHIDYLHLPSLGGRRRPAKDSKNTAWKDPSFRAYADYMETRDFEIGIESLLELANEKRSAIMCAEAVWWRCHRGLISDFLKSNGWTVLHLLNANRVDEHPYTSAASLIDGKLSYAGLLGGI